PRSGAPMHLPQRLSLLVLPHRVEVEAARPAQQQPPAVLYMVTRFGEERVELDEPRVDDERAARLERHDHALEPEGILDRDLRRLDVVAATGERLEHVLAVEAVPVPAQPRRALADARDPLVHGERPGPAARARVAL